MKKRAKPGEARAYIAVAAAYNGDDCLFWPYGRNSAGYGHVGGKAGWFLAHRLVCQAVHGPAPEGKPEAAHLCGNGHLGCCAPKHLEWKSSKENKADNIRHGKVQRGERQWMAKLREVDVYFIRQNASRMTRREIGERLGVSQFAVTAVVRGVSWSWLKGDGTELGYKFKDDAEAA
jgi:hypothetical protein